MTRNVSQEATADYCRFCGTADSQCFGKARTYLRWPADVDLDGSVYHFRICVSCALTGRSNTEVAAV